MACILADLDMDAVWAEADERERRVFVENLLAWIKVFPDHLEVKVVGSPPINVLLSEVGLKVPEIVGVGGPTRPECHPALAPDGLNPLHALSEVDYQDCARLEQVYELTLFMCRSRNSMMLSIALFCTASTSTCPSASVTGKMYPCRGWSHDIQVAFLPLSSSNS